MSKEITWIPEEYYVNYALISAAARFKFLQTLGVVFEFAPQKKQREKPQKPF